MKKLLVVIPFLVGGIGNAVAVPACNANTDVASSSQITTLLQGKTVRVPVGCSGNGCQWQELHLASGRIKDYKKGPSDPIDPSKEVGNWSVGIDKKITYTYDGDAGGPYVYSISNNCNGTYTFTGIPGTFVFSVN
ncbi:MAG: hypothetical protein HY853_03895 [Burkholderiales bacterium]|nr:hypothetical protein [Burkholderiales bacterium]